VNSQESNPGQLLELSGSYWRACALHAAVKLGVFTAIGKEALSGEEVADKLKGNARSVTMLLNALVAMKLLVKQGEAFSNAAISTEFLLKDSPRYIGHMIMHHHYLMSSWAQLDRAVITGSSVKVAVDKRSNEELENFLMGMFNMAMCLAPGLVKEIDLSGKSYLLDLGGGPGTYAIHFCLNNPQLKATVADLPTTRPFAQKTIEKFNLTDRIDFKDVDYLKENIPGTYDAAWLSHILHGEGPKEAQMIIEKAAGALKPGGLIIIHDFILNNTMDGPLFPAIFSLNMLLGTTQGQSYSEEQINNMLTNAGVKDLKRITFNSPNDSSIISGVV
jgi:SAM-dependent methyltransferase